MLGRADSLPGEGGEEGAVKPLQEADSYLAGKSCGDLATLMFQVLTAYPGKEVKKGLTDLCRRGILTWQENRAGTWQL